MMKLSSTDIELLQALQDGLPLSPRPYRDLAQRLSLSEAQIVERLAQLQYEGSIKRFGIIVRHHELGYCHNGMCVWDVPDERVDEVGLAFGHYNFVSLCYQRNRHLPDWPYNLFCMIHGRDRAVVIANASRLARENNLLQVRRDILFSMRRFKQRGARYPLSAVAPKCVITPVLSVQRDEIGS